MPLLITWHDIAITSLELITQLSTAPPHTPPHPQEPGLTFAGRNQMFNNSGRLHQISIRLMHTEMNAATDMKPTS